MISIVIVSHSPKVAEGVKKLAEQVSQKRIKVYAAGGVDDQTLGTNVERIHRALLEAFVDMLDGDYDPWADGYRFRHLLGPVRPVTR